jgi:hypothetical protein
LIVLGPPTDNIQSPVVMALVVPSVAAAVAVVAVVTAPVPVGPSAMTVTATLALGKLNHVRFQEGTSEWNDEKAGADLAAAEVKNDDSADPASATGPDGVNAAPEPEEDNTKSYEQYLADLREKRQALAGDSLAIRKPNEGSSQKFPEGKPVERVHEEYFAGAGGKQHRRRTLLLLMASTTPLPTLVTVAVVVPVVAVARAVVDVAVVRVVAVVVAAVARVVAVLPLVPAPSSAAVPVVVPSTPRTSLPSRPSAPKLVAPELHSPCGPLMLFTSKKTDTMIC